MRTFIGGSYTEVFVSGQIRRILTALWYQLEGPKPPDPKAFVNNGCTLSPDYLHGREVWPACVLHDYQTGPDSALDRKEADANLRKNVEFLLKAQGVFFVIAKIEARIYERAVRRLGRRLYHGTGDPAE